MAHLDAAIFDRKSYAKVTRPPMQAEPLPGWCYTDPDFHRREIERVFSRSWVCLGREDALPKPGDYRAIDFCGTKLILVRGQDGTLRALNNVCRHRGTVLLKGAGNVSGILCPFHAWGYALDGSLRGAPSMEKTEGFDKRDYRLLAFELALWQGFVFVRLEPGGPGLEASIGELDGMVRPYGFATMRTAGTRRFSVDCNWKLFVEVFMEDYHLKAVHKSSIAGTYTQHPPEVADRVNGEFATIWDAHDGTSALLTSERHLALPPIEGLAASQSGTRYALVYPSFVMACTVDCMWYFEVYPDGPSRTDVTMGMCFPETSVARPDFAEKFAAYAERWKIAMDEDIVVLEAQQAGMETGRYLPGRLSHLEPCVGKLASWLVGRAID